MANIIQNTFPDFSKSTGYKYYYKWYIEFFDPSDENLKIHPISLESVIQSSKYTSDLMPVLIMDLKFKIVDTFKLRDHMETCMVTVTLKSLKYQQSSSSGGEKLYTKVGENIEFTETFLPIFAKNAFDTRYHETDLKQKEMAREMGMREQNSFDTTDTNLRVSLFPIAAQKVAKTMFNTVIERKNNVGTALQWMIDLLPVNGVIVDPPDNDFEISSEIVIPPNTFINALKTLQAQYGIYETGVKIFYLNNILYILRKYGVEHEIESDDDGITHFYMGDADDAPLGPGDILRTVNDNFEPCYVGTIKPNVTKDTVMDGELKGQVFVWSSFELGIDVVAGKEEDNAIDPEKTKQPNSMLLRTLDSYKNAGTKFILDYDELNNPFNMAEYFNDIEANSTECNVAFNGVNIGDFKPNKFIEIHMKDNDKDLNYGGRYHIKTVTLMFNKVAGSEFLPDEDVVAETEMNGYAPCRTTCGVSATIVRK